MIAIQSTMPMAGTIHQKPDPHNTVITSLGLSTV